MRARYSTWLSARLYCRRMARWCARWHRCPGIFRVSGIPRTTLRSVPALIPVSITKINKSRSRAPIRDRPCRQRDRYSLWTMCLTQAGAFEQLEELSIKCRRNLPDTIRIACPWHKPTKNVTSSHPTTTFMKRNSGSFPHEPNGRPQRKSSWQARNGRSHRACLPPSLKKGYDRVRRTKGIASCLGHICSVRNGSSMSPGTRERRGQLVFAAGCLRSVMRGQQLCLKRSPAVVLAYRTHLHPP